MVDAICTEIELQKEYLAGQSIETIYFGGGTPSILLEEELRVILKAIHTHFDTSSLSEVTLESNPDDITSQTVDVWKNAGINRLSIGLQSFKESDLQWMNRAHNVVESYQCVETAQKGGITNLTVDLMYGLPNLSNEEWKNHVQTVVKMGVQHVSAYCLTVEEGTVLDHMVEKGKISTANEDLQAEQFLILVDTLEENGIHQYEISNFAAPGFESQHNSNYWKGVHYLGIGPSAHSYNGTSRTWNIANNQKYMQLVQAQESWQETEVLSAKDVFNEFILTGLRTKYGVNLQQLKSILPINKSFTEKIDLYCANKLMTRSDLSFQLTKLGRLQADHIAADLFID